MDLQWEWEKESHGYANYGNSNQWTVNAGLHSLARESAQNSNDARVDGYECSLIYSIIRLRSEERRAFENAIGWNDTLRPHLESMATVTGGSVMAGQIRSGIEAHDAQDELVLLRIEDYGCRGLTGPEFPSDVEDETEFGNFIKLCRLDLFSGKEEAAGGSFGLGKAVYWRFSRLQTVLFNSRLQDSDAVDGRTDNRLFGVNVGTAHKAGGIRFQGRGYFGAPNEDGFISSDFADDATLEPLFLRRRSALPGTSALMVGFHDPDEPDRPVEDLVGKLRDGLEENFWPLLARRRAHMRIELVDGETVEGFDIDPETNFAELTRALRRFDAGEADADLTEPYTMVGRDIEIPVPKRRTDPQHDVFNHTAKLVVTVSDQADDTLENRVCLFRKPEMVVQTVERDYPGHTYHAFLVAGVAIRPDSPSENDRLADDFLRYAEPPAHDQWIPGSARRRTSQVNLTANYQAPWVKNLESIREQILTVLGELFGAPLPPSTKGPQALMRHLRFLEGGKGPGSGTSGLRKPRLTLTKWAVEADGRWVVTVQAQMKNRPEGWSFVPRLVFVGVDGRTDPVEWSTVSADSGCDYEKESGRLVVPGRTTGRVLKATFSGATVAELPIPARDAGIDVVPQKLGAAELNT